ncbi:RNA polymerase epsilon subunit [Lactovum miscens]|uniref:DNA-directed RNA polymerase subunit epsilon n=1 Tax=Lactovum miscens TaxID=190387 RepID=A0A841C8F1_9LACT|nr:RNA polymerase epsilon subunit [Lactovum miscens]MBB5888008.1 DNA-dependent RNA polymerase auxiliary subunit epsilon [Lactovum miscens]
MIFKVFYQENKDTTPRRENTYSMYVEVDATEVLEGTILLRELIMSKTNYRIEFMDALTGGALEYEKENAPFKLTEIK